MMERSKNESSRDTVFGNICDTRLLLFFPNPGLEREGSVWNSRNSLWHCRKPFIDVAA